MATDFTKANLAYDLAKEVHKDQKRDGGGAYITHPVEVAMLIRKQAKYEFDVDLQVVALLHDAIEDYTGDKDELKRRIVDMFGTDIMRSLMLLTKLDGMDYADYIARMLDAKDRMALVVKLHDLTHNLMDHKKGARRDKYRLAVMLVSRALDELGEFE